MAWTAPFTWAGGDRVYADDLNSNLRDNMLEQAAAMANGSNPNRLVTASGLNSVEIRDWKASVAQESGTNEDTASTTYTDLSTFGPSVTLTCGNQAVVWITAQITNLTVNAVAWASFELTGATTSAAIDGRGILHQPAVAGRFLRTTVCTRIDTTPGSNTFTMKYRAATGTCRVTRRAIMVVGL